MTAAGGNLLRRNLCGKLLFTHLYETCVPCTVMMKFLNSFVDLMGLERQSHMPKERVLLLHFDMCGGLFSEVGYFFMK